MVCRNSRASIECHDRNDDGVACGKSLRERYGDRRCPDRDLRCLLNDV